MQRLRTTRHASLDSRWLTYQELEERTVLTSVTLELREIFRSEQQTLDGLSLADFDGDGDLDWLTTLTLVGTERIDGSNLALFKNDGEGNFEFSDLVNPESNQERPISMFSVGDIDNDGDQDIVALSLFGLLWDENDGSGNFERHIVAGSFDYCESLFHEPLDEYIQAIDFEGDGDLDIVTSHEACSSGFENLGGGELVPRKDFALNVSGNTTGLDWDDDGDADFISNGSSETKLLVNDGKEGLQDIALAHHAFDQWELFDLDGDGTRELVSRSTWLDLLAESRIALPPKFSAGVARIATANIDGDKQSDHFIVEQRCCLGAFIIAHWVEDTLDSPVFHQSPAWSDPNDRSDLWRLSQDGLLVETRGVDVDQDGDDDFFALLSGCSPTGGSVSCVILIENHLTGDANDDNIVNFADFLSLSNNFGKAADAAWKDGDFNLDGAVDFTDFLLLSAAFGETRR